MMPSTWEAEAGGGSQLCGHSLKKTEGAGDLALCGALGSIDSMARERKQRTERKREKGGREGKKRKREGNKRSEK